MTRSIPLSVKTAPAPSSAPSPDTSFLFNRREVWIMGVLNATPDSFYGGARAPAPAQALELAATLAEGGADVIDVGGESTRPGAEEISAALEESRVLPVLDALRARWPALPLSIDTRKAGVARAALARGARMINDVSALRHDPAMAEVAAEAGCPVVLMHMQGEPQTMQRRPVYPDVVDALARFFEERLRFAISRGIAEDRLILDPGIGFGKTLEHNLALLRRLEAFAAFGRPLLVGVSRKSMIGRLLAGDDAPVPAEDRLEGSLAAALWAVRKGAAGLRVHDAGATRKALNVWQALENPTGVP